MRVSSIRSLLASLRGGAETQRFARDARVQLEIGQYFLSVGRPDLARPCVMRSLELDPDKSETVTLAAALSFDAGDFEAVISSLAPRLETPGFLDRDDVVALVEAYQHLARHEEALTACERALVHHEDIHKDKAFRKAVKRSQKLCPQHPRIL